MEVIFHYGALADSLEEQANAQGFTLGNDAERLQKLNDAVLMCWFHNLCTDSQKDSMINKLQKQVLKSLKKKEGDI